MFGEELISKVLSPAKNSLQNIYNSFTRLEKKDTDILHYTVAKLLWVEKSGRPDIQPAISFLWTIMTQRTNEDKSKPRRVLQYLKKSMIIG